MRDFTYDMVRGILPPAGVWEGLTFHIDKIDISPEYYSLVLCEEDLYARGDVVRPHFIKAAVINTWPE